MENLRSYLVFVSHKEETDTHLYTLLANSDADAEQQGWQAFESEHTPDVRDEWNVFVFQAAFTAQPTHVVRVDRM